MMQATGQIAVVIPDALTRHLFVTTAVGDVVPNGGVADAVIGAALQLLRSCRNDKFDVQVGILSLFDI